MFSLMNLCIISIICFILGGMISFILTRMILKYRFYIKEQELKNDLQIKESLYNEKLEYFQSIQKDMESRFTALSSKVLDENSSSFLRLAETYLSKLNLEATNSLQEREASFSNLIVPIKDSLEKVDQKILSLETERIRAYEGMHQQIRDLLETQTQLRYETQKLSSSLRSPTTRGHWGEMQLRRVVELAGMKMHCDFEEQYTVVDNDTDGRFRPDLIIKLPENKIIVVDAKTPLSSYLEGMNSDDENIRKAKFKEHASSIRKHIKALSKKAYWEQFDETLEFVILFLPGDIFLNTAYEQDPTILEYAVSEKVFIATPTTLIALLTAISQGWRQNSLNKEAQNISNLGKELYDRLSIFSNYISNLGKNIKSTVSSYNDMVSSLEKRVFTTARKFNKLHSVSSSELQDMIPLDTTIKEISIEKD